MSIFEAVERGQSVDQASYEERQAQLRTALLEAQFALLEANRGPVLILLNGVDGAGKGETLNLLKEWMDTRHIEVHAVGEPTDEEAQRPPMWRFWRRLPAKGKIGVFFGSWYTQPILDRVMNGGSRRELNAALDEIRRFETMLSQDGTRILKFWFHLSKKAHRARIKDLEKDPQTRFRVTREELRRAERYDEFRAISEVTVRATSTQHAQWTLVDGSDERHRTLAVAEALLEGLRAQLQGTVSESIPRSVEPASALPTAAVDDGGLLSKADLSHRTETDAYQEELASLQSRLAGLTRRKGFRNVSPVLVFEGPDASGKGGAIRRVTSALDARIYDVVSVGAPTDEERAHPYLWRFWRHAPRDGKFVLFDRSWYGRVLVERVERLATEEAWQRAYSEILDFEEQLSRAGCPVVKFWMHISPEEQLRRFKDRDATGFKRFKLTPEDWRNRGKWDSYQLAAREMIEQTSTASCPWTVVEAEDKRWARLKVLRTVCTSIEDAL